MQQRTTPVRAGSLAAVLACLLVVSSLGSAVAAGGPSAADSSLTTDRTSTTQDVTGGETITLAQTVSRLPDRPGVYEARHEYRLPEGLGLLELRIPERATVTAQTGFVRQNDGRYAWDGETATPTLTLRVAANETTDRSGPIAGPGDYLFVDTGEWGLVSLPEVSHRWGWSGSGTVGFATETSVDGPGAAGERIAYLGAADRYTHTAHGQEFVLIVPEQASLAAPPEEIFASLAHASDRLRVGDRDETVFVVAAPTDQVSWGVRGLQTGDSDMWTRDSEPLAGPDNVWLHEYVHTRQGFRASADGQWFVEGAADYYAALLTLEEGRIDFEQFRRTLGLGTDGLFDGAVLADPSTWRNHANYYVGALVAGELDRRLRLGTDGRHSLQTVFWRFNTDPDGASAATFREAVADTGAAGATDAFETYTTTAERPGTWTSEQHTAAFGTDPARIVYGLADGGAVRISGPYRNRTVDAAGGLVLVPGERVRLDATATNYGGTSGGYEAALLVDGRREAVATGSLEPGASATLTFERSVEGTGAAVWTVGETSVPLTVRQPAEARVTGLRPAHSAVAPGETVTFSVTVTNDADYPGQRTLAVGDTERTVRLDAGESRTVTVAETFASPGQYTVGVGGQSATVTVRSDAGSDFGGIEQVLLLGVLGVLMLAASGLLVKRR